MKTISPRQKGGRGASRHDFSTPTQWNVEMVQNKVIVTLKGGGAKNDTDTSGMCGLARDPNASKHFPYLTVGRVESVKRENLRGH